MKIHVENLGKIERADIEVNDLTIICGPNSATKTWLSYSIYHHLCAVYDVHSMNGIAFESYFNITKSPANIDLTSPEFDGYITDQINFLFENSNTTLHKTFNTFPEIFEKSKISSNISGDFIEEIKKNLFESSETIMLFNGMKLHKEINSNIISFDYNDKDNFLSEDSDDVSLNEAISILLSHYIATTIDQTTFPYRPFVITSERVGSLVFQKDIDGTSLKLQDELNSLNEMSNSPETRALIRKLHKLTLGNRANLAIPVRKNLLAVRNAENELKKESYLKKEHPYVSDALKEIVKGRFEVEGGTLLFTADDNNHQLPITITSSSIKSLFLIDLYINSLAKSEDILLIDEPELNLHPDNQRLMARLLARVVNAGVKVIITTHSDFLIREINNSIALSGDFEDKESFLSQHNLLGVDTLKPTQVSAYAVNEHGNVNPMITSEYGIETEIFDNLINKANNLQDEILYRLDPSLFEEE